MSNEKILSRVKNSVTGEEYIIGTRGNKEQVALKLTVKTEVQWELFNISIQDLSDGTEQTKQLSADGECNFEIPLGNRYSITLPFVDGYTQPHALVYTASVSSRTIEYNYDNLNEYLTIRIAVRSELEEHTATMFNGLEVTCKGSNGINYTETIQNGQVTILIPYGITYTISMPQFDGLAHNHTNETFLAGVTARNLVYSYVDYNNQPVYGLDKDGNPYTIAELQAKGQDWAHENIVAGAFNNKTLQESERKNGGKGCGFCWDITNAGKNSRCFSNTIDLGINNQIISDAVNNNALLEACDYYNSAEKAYAAKDGAGETNLILQVVGVLQDAGVYIEADIYKEASQSKFSFNGIERNGFIMTYGQAVDFMQHTEIIKDFYNTVGRTAPLPITKNIVTTSCQYDNTYMVELRNIIYPRQKSDSNGTHLIVYDLP